MKAFDEAAAVAVVRRMTAQNLTEDAIARAIGRSRYFLTSLRNRYAMPKRPTHVRVEKPTSFGVPHTTRSEATGLWPLLRRSETVETLRRLIDISSEEEASLTRELGPLAARFVGYRRRVLREWNELVKARGIENG